MKSHQQVRLTVFALIGYILPSLVFAQADNITTSGNWNNTGIWSTSSLPTSTSTVGWPATATTVYFPQSSQLGSAFMVTIASMTMANNSTLNLGDGGSYSSGDTLIISGDLIDGNNSVINIKSNGILKVLGNLKVNNGLQLNVDAGGVLIVNGTVDIKNNTALELAGTVTIGSNLNLGNNGQITVPLGGVVTVNGSVSAGSNTCANVAGTFTVSGGCSGGGTNCGSGGNQSFCSALPITLSSFVGAQKDQSVELK